jgi:hypothetical protein
MHANVRKGLGVSCSQPSRGSPEERWKGSTAKDRTTFRYSLVSRAARTSHPGHIADLCMSGMNIGHDIGYVNP